MLSELMAVIALGLGVAGALCGCCNDVTTTSCFDWSASTTCPSREEAASKLDVDPHLVSGGKFWPAHRYLVDGHRVHEASMCCYEVTSTVCTTELD